MKVRDVIKHLQGYNLDADFQIIDGSSPVSFEIAYGDSEDVSRENCETVKLFINSNKEEEK